VTTSTISRGKSNGHAPGATTLEGLGTVVAEIPVSSIDIGPNVRTQPGELDELIASIREHGVLQPIKVRQDGDRFVVVWGQRRYLAAAAAGLERIPALIDGARDKPADRLAVEQLVENFHRADLNPIDEARALKAILDADPGLTQAALADRLGRSAPWVSNALRLLELAKPARELMASGALTTAHGKVLASLPKDEQQQVAKLAAKEQLTTRALEQEVARLRREREWDAKRRAEEKQRLASDVDVVKKKVEDLDAQIVVTGWNSPGRLAEALRRAGYKNVRTQDGFSDPAPPSSYCDCKAIEVRHDYGTPTVRRYCVVKKHREQARQDEAAKTEAKWAAERARLDAARAELKAQLAAHPLPVELARHFAWHVGTGAWSEKERREKWAVICTMTAEQLNEQLAAELHGHSGPPIDITPAEASV
jgi:ParB/RepB/Spo0J family partition protein